METPMTYEVRSWMKAGSEIDFSSDQNVYFSFENDKILE